MDKACLVTLYFGGVSKQFLEFLNILGWIRIPLNLNIFQGINKR